MTSEQIVREHTTLLRHGSDPLWVRLRVLLRQKGLKPEQVVLAESFTDDENCEFGVIVTPDRRIFSYDLIFDENDMEHAQFAGWTELSDTPDVTECYDLIPHAMKLLGKF